MADIQPELRKFVVPEIVFGQGARHMVARYAKNFGASKVLIVTDPGIIAAGWAEEVERNMEAAGIPYHLFSDLTSNPKEEEVMAGTEIYRREQCDTIAVVGGGSPMDCAKGIGIVSSNGGHILDFEGIDQIPAPGPPLICIPTTAGSSADVSQFAIITDTLNVDVPLRKLGMKQSDIAALAGKAVDDPCIATNPREPTQKDIERIYEQAL
ncbi:MAG TPA: iron-containing alcohol dehydrogenase [Dissulfurispiraceae bacterium]